MLSSLTVKNTHTVTPASARIHRASRPVRVHRSPTRRSATSKTHRRSCSSTTFIASAAADPDPNPPPWSSLSVPVYSLATVPDVGPTKGDSADRPSMNITTYCTPVTIKPTRRLAVALYTHTATARNMLATGKGVLQGLRRHHAELVPTLGKSSAHDVDKLEALRETHGLNIVTRWGVPTIEDAKSAVLLEIVSLETAGDHHLALCEVVDWENIEGEGEPLYTGDLPK